MFDTNSLPLSFSPVPPSEPASKQFNAQSIESKPTTMRKRGINAGRVSIDVRTVKAQGPRDYMEDCSCVEDLSNGRVFIGVFDGHGGIAVAQMCADQAPKIMKELLATNPDVSECMRLLYKQLDEKAEELDQNVGCTAAIALIMNNRIWFSNCGDAMIAIKMRNGEVNFVTQDHKVENEKERVESLGGVVTYWGGCARIYGTLNIARSIGDHFMKTYVISDPYVTATSCMKSEIEWITLATDGLWDVYTPTQLDESLQAQEMSLPELLRACYMRGSTDNVTIVQAAFKPIPT